MQTSIFLDPAFFAGFAACFVLMAIALLLFLIFAPLHPAEFESRPSRPPVASRPMRARIHRITAGLLSYVNSAFPRVRRAVGNVAGYAVVSAFWALFLFTLLAPQP